MRSPITARQEPEALRDELARSLNRPMAVELEAFADPLDSLPASIGRGSRLSHPQCTAEQYGETVAAAGGHDSGEYGIRQDC